MGRWYKQRPRFNFLPPLSPFFWLDRLALISRSWQRYKNTWWEAFGANASPVRARAAFAPALLFRDSLSTFVEWRERKQRKLRRRGNPSLPRGPFHFGADVTEAPKVWKGFLLGWGWLLRSEACARSLTPSRHPSQTKIRKRYKKERRMDIFSPPLSLPFSSLSLEGVHLCSK